MSVYLRLDESLITVAPALDDVEPILVVQTRFQSYAPHEPNGVIQVVQGPKGARSERSLHSTQVEGQSAYETRIRVKETEGLTEFETRTMYLAGGVGNLFYSTDRQVRFSAFWYGENNRYLELRVQVRPGAEIAANRGMATFGEDSTQFNFLGQLKKNGWAEILIDNHTHVGMSMLVHSAEEDFSRVVKKKKKDSQPPTGTRWSRLLKE